MKAIHPLAALICACSAQTPSNGAQSAHRALLPPDIVSYFMGNWKGGGKFTNGKELESELSFVPEIGNECILVRQKEKPPNTLEFIALWTVDSVSGDLLMLLASNHDSRGVFRSRGWQDSKIVFQSGPELLAHWALERFTFERESSSAFQARNEMSTDDGTTWRMGDTQTFTKRSSP